MAPRRPKSLESGRQNFFLTHGGKPLPLGPKVVETLLALVECNGGVASKARLLDRIWPEGYVGESNLAQNIYVLRKLFREHGVEGAIETVSGEGYRLAAAAQQVAVKTRSMRLIRYRAIAAAAAVAIAAGLALTARAGFGDPRTTSSTWSAASERLYATGRYYWDTRSRDGVRRSLTYFAGVIDESPLDARGYAAMADANVTMGDYCFGTHAPSVYFARAQYYAQRALALDANSAAAHASLGFIALHQGRTADALRQLGRAIALDPSYAPAREWYGIALLRNRDLERGLPQLKIAERLDPLSVSTIAWIASVARAQHRYSTAVLYTRMTRELLTQPINAQAHAGADHATWAAIESAPMFSLVNV